MAVRQEKRVEVHQDGDYVEKRRIVESGPSGRTLFVSRSTKLLWFIVSVIEILIAFRFILLAIGANAGSAFVDFIYSITAVLVAPFQFITPNDEYTGGVVEIASIFALFVYPIVVWGIIQLIWIVFADSRRTHQETMVHYD